MSEKLNVIRTDEEIDALIAYLQEPGREIVAYDTETDGLSLGANVFGISVCADTDEAFYIITREWKCDKTQVEAMCPKCEGSGIISIGNKKKTQETLECPKCEGTKKVEQIQFINGRVEELPNKNKVQELLSWLVVLEKALIGHNANVDWNWTLRNYGVDLRPQCFADTMVLAHLINENRRVGLKELGYYEFGEEAKKEQEEMMASVVANGGAWEKKKGGNKDMYRADAEILGKYGAKDALLTLRLFYKLYDQLEKENLLEFFFEESMPMANGPMYDLNTTGFKVDLPAMRRLQKELEDECALLKSQIQTDVAPYVSALYPKGFGDGKGQFNIGSSQQLAWLLFIKLEQPWKKLTDGGRDLAKTLLGKTPYNASGRRAFEIEVKTAIGVNGKPLKLEKYLKADKATLAIYAQKYVWIDRLLQYRKAQKLLNTYVIGMQEKIEYGIIHPGFLQCSTTGNRLSSRGPNFQQLPRDDKRVKACIVARPGRVFVGGDFEQIEPRVFASFSEDARLLACFESGQDIYSVIGIDVFHKHDCTPYKSGPNAFGEKYSLLRQVAKEIMLAATYGITAYKLCDVLNAKAPRKDEGPWTIEEVQQVIDNYFEAYPSIKQLQLKYHREAIENGVVFNLFGRPRHIPLAKKIKNLGKSPEAKDLPYEYRTLLNNAVNFPIQGTAGSIMSRCLIAVHKRCRELEAEDPSWADVKIVGQVHDEGWLEGPEHLGEQMVEVLKHGMETTVVLPGVRLKAQPKIARNLAELK